MQVLGSNWPLWPAIILILFGAIVRNSADEVPESEPRAAEAHRAGGCGVVEIRL